METLQKALIETALAYYHKGAGVQYDSEPLTYQDRIVSGPSRLCSGSAPEMGSFDWPLYTVCSDFCYNVYKNCFDYELMGMPRRCLTFFMTILPVTDPLVVLKGGREDGIQNKEEALEKIKNELQVGDILVEYARAVNGGPKGGHAMLYIGDYKGDGKKYLIHSCGKKIDMKTGVDQYEEKGSIVVTDYIYECFDRNSSSSHNCYLPWYDEFIILRPFQDPAFTGKLTPSAQARLKYPGLSIDRFFDRHRYKGAVPGETVTVTVSVKNNSTEAYKGLTVTETLPVGAQTADGTAPKWVIDLPAGSEMKLSYPVTITAADGETAVFPGGFVDSIPTREMSLSVREAAGASNMTATKFMSSMCQGIYGTELNLPDNPREMVTGFFDLVEVPDVEKIGTQMLTPKKYEDMEPMFRKLWDKLMPEHVGGRAVYLGHDMKTMGCFGRIKQFEECAYRPGDVFFCLESPSIIKVGNIRRVRMYLYMGASQVLTWDADLKKPVVLTFKETLGVAMKMNVILGFRP